MFYHFHQASKLSFVSHIFSLISINFKCWLSCFSIEFHSNLTGWLWFFPSFTIQGGAPIIIQLVYNPHELVRCIPQPKLLEHIQICFIFFPLISLPFSLDFHRHLSGSPWPQAWAHRRHWARMRSRVNSGGEMMRVIPGWWWLEPWNFMTFHSVGNLIILSLHHLSEG